MTTIHVAHISPVDALHHRYPGQSERQDCYIELDCQDGELTADYNAEIGNAVPMAVHHGHVRRYTIPCLRADAANDLLDEIAPFAQRIVDGYSSRWDGSNHIADLTEDAVDAEESIRDLIVALEDVDAETVNVWQAGDWFATLGGSDRQRAELRITAATTDEELAAMAKQEEKDAAATSDEVDAIEGMLAHLTMLRDTAPKAEVA